jgi:hypothetical protein
MGGDGAAGGAIGANEESFCDTLLAACEQANFARESS